MEAIIALAYGIITFAVIIGVGVVVIQKFGDAIGAPGNTTTAYLNTQLGSSGLAGWTPAIIAITIGMFFLGMFMIRGAKR